MTQKLAVALATAALIALTGAAFRTAKTAEYAANKVDALRQEYGDALNWIGDSLEELARVQGVRLPKRPVVRTDDHNDRNRNP